jgi:glyoxylase-like metal-dependent hydrolase (beta-lactamase superfamily II)
MRKFVTMLIGVLVVLSPLAASAQDSRAALDAVAKAMGAGSVKSIQYSGNGVNFQVGQNYTPDLPWPRFVVKSYTRTVSYETAAIRDQLVRTLGETPQRGGGAGGLAPGADQRQEFVARGDFSWNVAGETAAPSPVALFDRQLQLWTTPHGVIKMAIASGATVRGNTMSFLVPGRFRVQATVDGQNLVERVDAVVSNAVLGDMPVEIRYSEYRDFGGVKFPMKIRQTIGGHPALDLTVTDVQPNAALNVTIPEAILNTANPYGKVTSQSVAEGVWYLTGGTHHSVLIEMKDHLIVVESPLNDDRAVAVLAEVKKLSSKPLKYVIASHHHFDHSGGLRAIAAEGVTIIAHDANKAFFEKTLAASAAVNPDRLAKSGKKGTVEGVGARRTLTDGTRTVDIHQIGDNVHHGGIVMVHLPKEKLLVEADVYTPPAPNAPPATSVNPTWVSLSDNIKRLNLAVDQLLPLHGRMVPLADLHKAIGHSH